MSVLSELERQSDARFLALYQALSQNGFGPLDGELAKALKFRPIAMKKLPMEVRAKRARAWIQSKHNADLAYELFGSYLLKTKRGLITGFLDKTGVPHQDGMIEELEQAQPDATKLEGAVAELEREHGAEDVTLYLAMCAYQWPALAALSQLYARRAAS